MDDTTRGANGKRYTGIATTRIAAGGGYDEWIEVADSPSVGDFVAARKSDDKDADVAEIGLRMLARMIKSWSLDLPVSYDSLTTLPFALIQPAFEHVNNSFLSAGLVSPSGKSPT